MNRINDFKSRFRILKGGKISLVVSAMVAGTTLTFASPTDGVVTSGTANITQSGNTTNINQSSNKASINWNKFDIKNNETVNFNQPNSSSITLNRVVGNEKSVIDGALNANGQVWILNSNGILFNKNAKINTAGLIATTAELSDTNFQNGNYDFKNNSSESVINLGTIEVSNNGSIVLAANEVVNSGTIKAVRGKVHLTAANEYTVNLNGNSLVNLIVTKGVLDAMIENSGTISANGGEIYLTTNAVNELLKGVVNNTGIIEANSLDGLMGKVNISSNIIVNNGEIKASGEIGGTVKQTANMIIDAGTTDVSAINNAGTITQNSQQIKQSNSAVLKADSKTANAGTINIKSDVNDTNSNVYISGTMSATGVNGGKLNVTANSVSVVGANITTAGTTNAGEVKIGGDWQGTKATLDNATTTSVLNSNITNEGKDGTIVVWSDSETSFNSKILAKDSNVEISSKDKLNFLGVNVQAKNLLLDPKNIEIKDVSSGFNFIQINNQNGISGDNFQITTELSNGNFVATATGTTIGVNSNVGAVYLFKGDGTLISSLFGSTANDKVGNGGVTALSNGNYVVRSSDWDNEAATDAGAVTWGSGTLGVSGVINSTNSLVGTKTDDSVGNNGITALSNGNYVVSSSYWANGTAPIAGAVTWGSGTNGISGVISASNSLVGTKAYDYVGNLGVTALSNGNYVVLSRDWVSTTATNVGAVTWGNGTSGISGVISDSNSLVGINGVSAYFDGIGITALSNGNYVVISSDWDSTTATNVGAITWGNGLGGTIGVVNASNSLVGTKTGDRVGSNGITALSNGNYVVVSERWANGTKAYAGAVTWGNGLGGTIGAVSDSNSLVGTTANDRVGMELYGSGIDNGITALSNGNYVVGSTSWDSATATDAGAVTWGNGLGGTIGAVSASNSLVGSKDYDYVGSNGITTLSNGNYVVRSDYWDNGNIVSAGAVTWGNGTSGISGEVSASNSLVGTKDYDNVGNLGVTALSNGNYVVSSRSWANGTETYAGAVTWGSGTNGISGVISASNSLVGTKAYDYVGDSGVTALSNGNYVVGSSSWDSATATNVGAVIWGNGTSGISGVISASNSLVGSTANDKVGNYGITALSNGNYVVGSGSWDNGAETDAGALTWGNGLGGTTGVVSATNSLVGTKTNDNVGYGEVTALSNGNYVVRSYYWDNGEIVDAGAVTWGNGDTNGVRTTGSINSNNSFIGQYSVIALKDNKIALNNTSASNGGTTYITDFSRGDYISTALFSTNASADSVITPDTIKALLDAGTAVTLQANNDITLSKALSIDNTSGNGGALTFQAGRNINLNANITTDNGNFTALAGDKGADSTNTDEGTPTIAIANGVTINAGTGNIILYVNAGNFINNSGSTAPFTASLTSIYLPSYTNATLNNLLINGKRYNTTYSGGCLTTDCVLPTSGVNMLYSVAPVLTITPNSNQIATYGDAFSSTYSISGYVDSDTLVSSGITGTAAFTAGTKSSSDNYIAGTHNVAYSSGLLSSLGYSFKDDSASSGEYTISKADISAITGITASNKTYDGLKDATLSTTNAAFTGMIKDDTLTVATKTGTFADKNVGDDKTVSITDLTLGGTDAANYNLPTTIASTKANITRLDSVTWIGGTIGNWFDPSNWANGAVPDLSNVANVIIPKSVTVSFNTNSTVFPADASQAVNIDTLGSEGNLVQDNGTLNTGTLTLSGFTQNSGTLNTNNLSVTKDFQQIGISGFINILVDANINQSSGSTQLGNITVGNNLNIKADADIKQIANTALNVTGVTTLASTTGNVVLKNANNDFKSTVSVEGKDIELQDVNALDVTLNASGNSDVQSAGNLKVAGTTNNLKTVTTNGGTTTFAETKVKGKLDTLSRSDIKQIANSKIIVEGTIILDAGNNDIILNNANNQFKSTVLARGRTVSMSGLPVVVEPTPTPEVPVVEEPKKVDDIITAIANQTVLKVKAPQINKPSSEKATQEDIGNPTNTQAVEGNQGPKSVIRIVNGGVATPDGLPALDDANTDDKKN